jgi:UDP-MurNAc hydroxylase
MLRMLSSYRCRSLFALQHGETLDLPGGSLTLYVDDSELNRDSAMLVRDEACSFFNMNDCKLFDALAGIHASGEKIDVFTCQYSGAIWHPVCYEYDPVRYAAISTEKYLSKFDSVARAIETLRPKMYFPSAGPPCFLDPELFHLNTQPVNIFPSASRIIEYLEARLRKSDVRLVHVVPGDRVEAACDDIRHLEIGPRVDEKDVVPYLRNYAAEIGAIPANVRREARTDVVERLRTALEEKLAAFSLAARIDVPLHVFLWESPCRRLRVDFQAGCVEKVPELSDEHFYELSAPAWQVERMLDGHLSWDAFGLTFRVKLRRNPDVYQPLLYAFLVLETEHIPRYCERISEMERNQERIIVQSGGKHYSVLRWCPHMGADLSRAVVNDEGVLTCPRHRWRFDLEHQGQCISNHTSICAEELMVMVQAGGGSSDF